jgi:hypothetical protein
MVLVEATVEVAAAELPLPMVRLLKVSVPLLLIIAAVEDAVTVPPEITKLPLEPIVKVLLKAKLEELVILTELEMVVEAKVKVPLLERVVLALKVINPEDGEKVPVTLNGPPTVAVLALPLMLPLMVRPPL